MNLLIVAMLIVGFNLSWWWFVAAVVLTVIGFLFGFLARESLHS